VRHNRQFTIVRIDYAQEGRLFGKVDRVHDVHRYISFVVNHDFSFKLYKAFLLSSLN
jgi:hypothetical protein